MLDLGQYAGLVAGIKWGTAGAKTLRFGFPMLDVRTYTLAREGSKLTRAMVEATDGWSYGHDHFIEFRLPAIPPEDEFDPYGFGDASGWDSADGWADFLDYARRKIVVQLVPDLDAIVSPSIDCYLVEPWDDAPSPGWNLTRDLTVKLRAASTEPGVAPVFFEGY